MPALSTRTEIRADVLLRLADARLAEFELLRAASPPQYAGAFYLGGYAVEALLQRLICQALNLDELPVVFHTHDLDAVLFFSGRYKEIQADAGVWDSFTSIQGLWDEKRRYADPATATATDCDNLEPLDERSGRWRHRVAEGETMRDYEERVKRALEEFCRQYTGRDTGWHVETWLHPITRSVRSVTVVPEFVGLDRGERMRLIKEYLRAHLSHDEYVRLSLAMALTPDEHEHTDWRPPEVEMVAAVR